MERAWLYHKCGKEHHFGFGVEFFGMCIEVIALARHFTKTCIITSSFAKTIVKSAREKFEKSHQSLPHYCLLKYIH
jgi:hypothetical protein